METKEDIQTSQLEEIEKESEVLRRELAEARARIDYLCERIENANSFVLQGPQKSLPGRG